MNKGIASVLKATVLAGTLVVGVSACTGGDGDTDGGDGDSDAGCAGCPADAGCAGCPADAGCATDGG